MWRAAIFLFSQGIESRVVAPDTRAVRRLSQCGMRRESFCWCRAERGLRTPEVAPQFRDGEEIDLSQFWRHASRSLWSRLGNATCRYRAATKGGGMQVQGNFHDIRRSESRRCRRECLHSPQKLNRTPPHAPIGAPGARNVAVRMG